MLSRMGGRSIALVMSLAACGASRKTVSPGTDGPDDAGGTDSVGDLDAGTLRDAGEGDARSADAGRSTGAPPGEDRPGGWVIAPDSEVVVVSTPGQGTAYPVGLDRTPDGFGLVWVSNGEVVRLSRLDEEGGPLDDVDVSGPPAALLPVAWTGASHVLVWGDERAGEREIYLRAASEDLELDGEMRLTTGETPQEGPGAAWTGSELAFVWRSEGDLLFARAGIDGGTVPGSMRALTSFGTVTRMDPDVVAADGRAAIVFVDGREGQNDVFFALVDELGEPTTDGGEKVFATEDAAEGPLVTFTGTEFETAWTEDRQVLFARVEGSGTPVEGSGRSILPFVGERGPSRDHWARELLWTGLESVLLAERSGDRVGQIVFVRLDAEGGVDPVNGVTVVWEFGGNLQSENPLAVPISETEIAVVWGRLDSGGEGLSEIRFARLVLESAL